MVLDDFRCSPMVSKTGKNIEITRLQGSSVSFNALPYITLKASPKRKVVGSNPASSISVDEVLKIPSDLLCLLAVCEKGHPTDDEIRKHEELYQKL